MNYEILYSFINIHRSVYYYLHILLGRYSSVLNQFIFIKEIKIAQTLQTIPFDIRKSTIVIFLNEILLKSIKEQEANPELFDFIYRGIVGLDNTSNRIADFHLFFTIHLTKYLGFFPRDNYDDSHTIFDMQEGIYQDSSFGLKYYIGEKLNLFWHKLHTENFENAGPLQINALQRQELLQKINDYYSIHLPAFKNIKSMQVLSEVLK